MKADCIYTFVIGKKLPAIVDYCLQKNEVIVRENGIKFTIVNLERDYNFICPGVQVEYAKISYLSNNVNIMVIDYDILLTSIIDLEFSKNLYCGHWINRYNNRPDGFLIYSNSVNSRHTCRVIKNRVDNQEKMVTGFLFSELKNVSANKYPDTRYIHYNLDTGLNDLKDSIDTCSQTYVNRKIKGAQWRNRGIWPL